MFGYSQLVAVAVFVLEVAPMESVMIVDVVGVASNAFVDADDAVVEVVVMMPMDAGELVDTAIDGDAAAVVVREAVVDGFDETKQ